jgi:hypothetical protein
MRRAARADGWLPNLLAADGPPGKPSPDTIRDGVAFIRDLRESEGLPMDGYDVITEGVTPADDPAAARAEVAAWEAAGATWWIEGNWSVEGQTVQEYAVERLSAGPPR